MNAPRDCTAEQGCHERGAPLVGPPPLSGSSKSGSKRKESPRNAEQPYENYSGRVHNLDGFLRLVSLQTAIKRAGIRDSAVEKFLVDTAPEQRNPYTGEAMQWDAGSRAIYFNGYNEKADGDLLSKRIEVRL